MIQDKKILAADAPIPLEGRVMYFTDDAGVFNIKDETGKITKFEVPTYTLTLANGGTREAPIHQQIQDFIDKIEADPSHKGGNVFIDAPPGNYWIGRQIRLSHRTGIISQPGINFKCTTASAGHPGNPATPNAYAEHYQRFPGGYMFTVNCRYTDNTYTEFYVGSGYNDAWLVPFPTVSGAVLSGIRIVQDDNNHVVPIHLVRLCAPHPVENCYTWLAHDLVIVPSIYMDNLSVTNTRAAFSYEYRDFGSVTVTTGTPGVINWTAHGRTRGNTVRFSVGGSGTAPTGITIGIDYYVSEVLSADTFTISATRKGATIALTAGTAPLNVSSPKPVRSPDRYTGRVQLSNTGDYVVLNNVHGNIRLAQIRAADIISGAGNILLTNTISVNISGRHEESEYQWLELNNSTATLTGNHYWKGQTPKIRLRNNSHATIIGMESEYVVNAGLMQFELPAQDVAVDARSSISVIKSFSVLTWHSNIGFKHRNGLQVAKWDTSVDNGTESTTAFTNLDDWNLYSHLLSTTGSVDTGFRVNLNHSIDSIPNVAAMSTQGIFVQNATLSSDRWNKTGQTETSQYYYRIMDAIDWRRNFFNAGAAPQVSGDRTNGTTTVTRLVMYPVVPAIYGETESKGYYPRLAVVLRTRNTGSAPSLATPYDDIAFIPIPEVVAEMHFIDTGDYINGVKWRAYGQARPATDYRVSAASWKHGKFTGVIPSAQARPVNAAGVDSLQGLVGDQLLLDSPIGLGNVTGYIKAASNSSTNLQWRGFGIVQDNITSAKANTNVTTSRALTSADLGSMLLVNSATEVTLTIPVDSTLGTGTSEYFQAYQQGVGKVTFVAGSGVTLQRAANIPDSLQYNVSGVMRIGTNAWTYV